MKVATALFLLCAALPAQEIALRAGVARAEITPSTLGPMYGYSNRRCGPAATGANDPLFAKALVLEAGGTRMAIVTMDLGRVASKDLFRRAADELKIPLLLLSVTHTHSAPAVNPNSPLHAEIEQKVFDILKQASQSMFPARLGVGRGSLQLGYNRLLPREDGRSRALFDNLKRIPYGPVDPEFQLLRVSDGEGKPRALLIHYAAHAVVLGPTNCKYSADYPGVVQAKVEAAVPGAQAMFVMGGAGDINPLFQGRTGNEEADFTAMREMGESLAASVLAAAQRIEPAAPPRHPIAFRHDTLSLRHRWNPDRAIETGIATVLINREIAIATVPGEPFHKLQLEWKQKADAPHAFFYGYTQATTGDWPGYIPDLKSAAYGGYGADNGTNVEIGAGEKIVQQHVANLYGLLGMFRNQPGRP